MWPRVCKFLTTRLQLPLSSGRMLTKSTATRGGSAARAVEPLAINASALAISSRRLIRKDPAGSGNQETFSVHSQTLRSLYQVPMKATHAGDFQSEADVIHRGKRVGVCHGC